MTQRLDKFLAINTFIAIADTGSFTAASHRLGISVATATKTIARLEEKMSVQLLHRNTRKVALTDEGTEFYQRCTRILAELDEAENFVYAATQKPAGVIRLAVAPAFGRVTLIPALPAFFERYPDIQIEMDARNENVDIIAEGYDCWIAGRSDLLESPGLAMRLLARSSMKIFGAASYFEKHGVPAVPSDLARHNCITIDSLGAKWKFRLADGTTQTVPVTGNLRMSSGDALREAVAAGVGITLASSWLFRTDSKSNAVRTVLDEFVTGDRPVSVVFPKSTRLPNKLRVFIDYLVEITKSSDNKSSDRQASA